MRGSLKIFGAIAAISILGACRDFPYQMRNPSQQLTNPAESKPSNKLDNYFLAPEYLSTRPEFAKIRSKILVQNEAIVRAKIRAEGFAKVTKRRTTGLLQTSGRIESSRGSHANIVTNSSIQVVFFNRARRASFEKSLIECQIAVTNLEIAQEKAIRSFYREYLSILFLTKEMVIRKEILVQLEEKLEAANVVSRLGRMTNSDVSEIERSVLDARFNILDLRSKTEAAVFNIGLLAGGTQVLNDLEILTFDKRLEAPTFPRLPNSNAHVSGNLNVKKSGLHYELSLTSLQRAQREKLPKLNLEALIISSGTILPQSTLLLPFTTNFETEKAVDMAEVEAKLRYQEWAHSAGQANHDIHQKNAMIEKLSARLSLENERLENLEIVHSKQKELSNDLVVNAFEVIDSWIQVLSSRAQKEKIEFELASARIEYFGAYGVRFAYLSKEYCN